MKAAIIIPVFNHAITVQRVIEQVRAACDGPVDNTSIIVFDDGSTDGTAALLDSLTGIMLLRHTRNRGKGAALHAAFMHADAQGFTHAITVDADGQHDPADVLAVLSAARLHPHDLIIGHRDMDKAQCPVPMRSKKGRNASRFWIRLETGQNIPDTQCGLRAYPLGSTLAVPHRFRRYDFETEILARLSWGGVTIRSLPVRCIYFSPSERVSHFRPIVDTLRGIRVNAFLVARRLLPLPFKRLVNQESENPSVRFGSWWKRSSWENAIRESLQAGSTNAELAMAFALGIFVGLTPFYMLQTILAIYFARRMHLNVLAAVIGSQISIPPLAPIWLALSLSVGNLLLKGTWVFNKFEMQPFFVGNILVALAVAIVGLLTARDCYTVYGASKSAD